MSEKQVRITFTDAQNMEFKDRLLALSSRLETPLTEYLDTFQGVPLDPMFWERLVNVFAWYHDSYAARYDVDVLRDNEGKPIKYIVRHKDKNLEDYFPQDMDE